jgi:hypothetical protein
VPTGLVDQADVVHLVTAIGFSRLSETQGPPRSGLSPTERVSFCDGFRMTAHRDGAACTGAVVRKPHQGTNPREKCAEGAARSAMGIWVARKGGVCDDRNALEGEQWRAWWEAAAGVDG